MAPEEVQSEHGTKKNVQICKEVDIQIAYEGDQYMQKINDTSKNIQSINEGVENVKSFNEGVKSMQSDSDDDKDVQRKNEGKKNMQSGYKGDKSMQNSCEGGRKIQSSYEGNENILSGYKGDETMPNRCYEDEKDVQSCYKSDIDEKDVQSCYKDDIDVQREYEEDNHVQIVYEGNNNMQSNNDHDHNMQSCYKVYKKVQSCYEGGKKVQSCYEGEKKAQIGFEGFLNIQSGIDNDKNMLSSYQGDQNVQSVFEMNMQSCYEGDKKIQYKNDKKKVLRKITIALKKEIVEKHECGVRVSDLALQYKMAKSTVSTILKNRDAIKGADVAKGVTTLTKQRTQVLEEVEKLLLVWLNEKQLAGDSVSEAMICDKARKLHTDLLQKNPSTSAASEEFKASRGWFANFRKRSGIHSMIKHGEDSSFHRAASEAYKKEFAEYVQAEGYVAQQVFSCDETGLFWKKMPKRTYITLEEKALPGHKPMKDRLTLLLCANASADLKIKPLLVYHSQTPRAFKQHHVDTTRLPVMWRANAKAWVTRQFFMEWLHEVFAPSVKKYLSDNQLPERCLLLMDNAPGHPQSLEDVEYGFIKIKFLPPNMTAVLQPIDQQVICNFKKLYTKALFTLCFNVTEETSLTLREFWKKHFNILHCIDLIDTAWQDVAHRTLNSGWWRLWPACVTEHDFEGSDAEVLEEILSMGMCMGLEVDGADIEELVEEHKEELTTEVLAELQKEQQKVLVEEHFIEEEEDKEEVSTEMLKSIMEKWNECQNFFEKHHPNITLTNAVLNVMNDNVVSYFWRELQLRKKHMTFDRLFIKNEPTAKRQRRLEAPEGDLLDVLMEGSSPSEQ